MGLFRLGALVAVGIAVMPSDSEQQEMLYNRAASATAWAVTFCDRNAATCAQAAAGWQVFVAKAEFTARVAYDLITDNQAATVRTAADDGAPERRPPDGGAVARSALAPTRLDFQTDTLTTRDREPAWRAKTDRKSGI
ncbi:MAG: DUF5330 domain-containing protein [Hyphomicrobium sp.]